MQLQSSSSNSKSGRGGGGAGQAIVSSGSVASSSKNYNSKIAAAPLSGNEASHSGNINNNGEPIYLNEEDVGN